MYDFIIALGFISYVVYIVGIFIVLTVGAVTLDDTNAEIGGIFIVAVIWPLALLIFLLIISIYGLVSIVRGAFNKVLQ